MKNFYKYSGFLLSLFLMLTISCQDFTEPNDELLKSGKISQNTPPKGKNKTPAELTNQETDGILYLREEEKLAHNVYVQFYALYQNNIFLNVIDAEQRHTDAILDLINFYSLTDPAAGKAVGEFLNTDLQARYDSLVGVG